MLLEKIPHHRFIPKLRAALKEKEPGKGTAVVLLGSQQDRMAAVMSGRLFPKRLFRSVVIKRRLPEGYGKSGTVRVDVLRQGRWFKEHAPVFGFAQSPASLKRRNTFLPLHNEMSFLLEDMARLPRTKRLEYLHAVVSDALSSVHKAGYADLLLAVDLGEVSEGLGTAFPKPDAKTFASLLFMLLSRLNAKGGPELKDAKIVFKDFAGECGFVSPLIWPPRKDMSRLVFSLMRKSARYMETGEIEQDGEMEEEGKAKAISDVSLSGLTWFVSDKAKAPKGARPFDISRAAAELARRAFMDDPDLSEMLREGDIQVGMEVNVHTDDEARDRRRVRAALKGTRLRLIEVSISKNDLTGLYGDDGRLKEAASGKTLSPVMDKADRNIDVLRFRDAEGNDGRRPTALVTYDVEAGSEKWVEGEIDRLRRELKVNTTVVKLSREEEALYDELYRLYAKAAAEAGKGLEAPSEKRPKNPRDAAALAVRSSKAYADLKAKLAEGRLVSVDAHRKAERVKALKARQDDAVILDAGGETRLADRIGRLEAQAVEPAEMKFTAINPEIKSSTSEDFRTGYTRKLADRDLYRCLSAFGESEDLPIFVDSVERADASNADNHLDMLRVKFMLPNGRPQTMRVTVPRVSDEGYLYLNGSKKIVTNQMVHLPIVKIQSQGEDVVHFSTNYKKAIMSRSRGSLSPSSGGFVKGMKRMARDGRLSGKGFRVVMGKAGREARSYVGSLEFDELSKHVSSIRSQGVDVIFSRKEMTDTLEKRGFDMAALEENAFSKGMFPFGAKGSAEAYLSDYDGNLYAVGKSGTLRKDPVGTSLTAFCRDILPEDMRRETEPESPGKRKYVFSRVRILNERVPTIVFLGYAKGLEAILDEDGVSYEIVPKEGGRRPKGSFTDSVEFEDATLFFDGRELRHALLVNGMRTLGTRDHAVGDYDAKGDGWHGYFKDVGKPRFGRGMTIFQDLFLDPVTVEVLQDLDLPSTLTGSFLHCNALLQNPDYSRKNDMSIYRARNNEIINAHVYRVVADNIRAFRNEGAGPSAVRKLTLPEMAVTMSVMEDPVVQNVALLNPVREAEILAGTTYKGKGGSPLGHAQGTEEIRNFSESMRGIYGMTTVDDANTGVRRKLSLNAQISSHRGYLKAEDGADLDATNILSASEMLSPFTPQHADPPRVGMMVAQTAHQVPTKVRNKPLVTSGGHKAIAALSRSDFVFKALEDGVVERVDRESRIAVLKYGDGTKGVVDLSVRNIRSPEGFYTVLEHEGRDLKPGRKFKKGDVLAADKRFFHYDGNETSLTSGTLAKIALAPLNNTYEDSSLITEGLAGDLAVEMAMASSVVLSKGANIGRIAKVGDKVRTGDVLVLFEEVFDDDGELADLLAKMDEKVSEAGKAKTSKHTGEIVDIRLYWNYPIDEYSEDIKKLIRAYVRRHSGKDKLLDEARSTQITDRRSLEMTADGRARSQKFDGLFIEFYVRTEDAMSVGNKLTLSVALKSIVSEIVPDGEAPYSEFRRDEPVRIVMSPMSVVSRMTQDFFLQAFANKVLVELKERVRDIHDGKAKALSESPIRGPDRTGEGGVRLRGRQGGPQGRNQAVRMAQERLPVRTAGADGPLRHALHHHVRRQGRLGQGRSVKGKAPRQNQPSGPVRPQKGRPGRRSGQQGPGGPPRQAEVQGHAQLLQELQAPHNPEVRGRGAGPPQGQGAAPCS